MRDCTHGQLARSCNICEMEQEIERLRAELAELRKPDCRTCWHFDEHAFICTRATRIAICRTGEGYQRADPVRLYERGEE